MSSLTSPRNTVTVGPQLYGTEQPMDAGEKVVEGCLVALDGYGMAQDMTKAASLTCVGIAVRSVDNSSGQDGDLSCVAITGRFMFDNGTSTDTITQADVYKTCYALDNHTVTRLSSGASAVGTVKQLDAASGQVIVEIA